MEARWANRLFPGVCILLFYIFVPVAGALAQGAAEEQGRIEFGIRQLYGERRSAKFSEYRDIPQGFYIRHAEVDLHELFNRSFFLNFQTRDTEEGDQTYLLGLGMARKYRLDLRWDQTPHVFTTAAKSFFIESSPGVFTAPFVLRSFLESQPTSDREAALQAVLDTARPLAMSTRRDKGSGVFTLTPTPDWTLRTSYSREKISGYRPFGTTVNRFTNITELPEPIDYRTHEIQAGTEYARQRGGFQATYTASIFKNRVSTLVWDNSFVTTDSLGSSAHGRLDLYPDNTAQNLNLAGAINIPHSTRLMASVSPGWMRQNDSFLPYTINTAIPDSTPPGTTILPVPELPAMSLDGSKQTLAMNYTVNTEAVPHLPITLRYRSYDYNNNTPGLIFPDWVITDAYSYGIARRNVAFAYDRKTLGLDASWDFAKNSHVAVLYEWERYNRVFREVAKSTENTVGASIDLTPRRWLLLRGSYKYSDRNPEHYTEEEFEEEAFPFGEGDERNALGVPIAFPMPQIPSARKYDQAARTRHRAEALLQVTPEDFYSFDVSYGTTQDGYEEKGCIWLGYDQCYGLLKDISYDYTFEFTLDPHPDVSLFADYTLEKYKYRQISRQRTPAGPTRVINDSPNNDWESVRRDRVDNYTAGLNASLPGRVKVDLFYTLSAAINKISTRALGDPTIAGFLVTTAEDYPDTSNRWHQLVGSVEFPLKSESLTPKLEYRYEQYDRIDFQLVNVNEYFINDPSTVTGIFLGVGADVPGYKTHIVSLSLVYRF